MIDQLLDVSVAGSRWVAAASPSLAHLIGNTARDISHPTDPQRTLWDAAEDAGPYKGPIDDEFKALYESTLDNQKAAQTGVFPLGSGSDFTVFLQRLGVCLSFIPGIYVLTIIRR